MQWNDPIVIFLTIQFSVSHLFAYSLKCETVLFDPQIGLWSIISLGLCRPGSNSNVEVPQVPQSSSITGARLSDSLVSYPGHSLRESNLSAEYCSSTLMIQVNITYSFAHS